MRPPLKGSGEYVGRDPCSDQAAAQALMYSIKSTMVPLHDAMVKHFDGNETDYTTQTLAALQKGQTLPVPQT